MKKFKSMNCKFTAFIILYVYKLLRIFYFIKELLLFFLFSICIESGKGYSIQMQYFYISNRSKSGFSDVLVTPLTLTSEVRDSNPLPETMWESWLLLTIAQQFIVQNLIELI